MKRKIYFVFLIVLILSALLNAFGIVNAMTSLKYETAHPGDCISIISGSDLCAAIVNMKSIIAVAVVLIYLLLYFQNKILKTQKQ